MTHGALQVTDRPDRRSAGGGDQVTARQAGGVGRAASLDADDEYARLVRESQEDEWHNVQKSLTLSIRLNENLIALFAEGGLTVAQIVQLVRNSFEVAWIDAVRRDAYLAQLDRYLAQAAA